MSSTASHRTVLALVDCNSFYCSCERLFAPHLEKKPIVVLSNNDGCVVSRTEEAKELGIPMGVPFFEIRALVKRHGVHVFSSNYSLYGEISSRVMRTLSQFTPEIEVYSIDEAFLDLTGFRNVGSYGHEIRETVRRHVGIPVSVGLGPTKVLAKVANKIAKKRKEHGGVFDLCDAASRDVLLGTVAVGEIWGVGARSREKLTRNGIRTARDLRDADPHIVGKLLTVVGRRIASELRGETCLPLETVRKNRKEICCARGFGRPVRELGELKEAMANYVTSAAERLRKQGSSCELVTVFLQTDPHKETGRYFNQRSTALLAGTSATHTLITVAGDALKNIFKPGFAYKRTGVILSGLVPEKNAQLSLLKEGEGKNRPEVMRVVDRLNERMGSHTVRFGTCGVRQEWKMLSRMRSPSYTTRWSDLPVAG
ncbi:MAG: Y-family DNA polymerase [Pseudomonadota bacterium]